MIITRYRSSIIDKFKLLSASDDGHAVAYFYCSYKEPDRSDAASILRTLIKQFCINKEDCKVPTLVDQLYQMKENRGDANHPLNPEESTELIIALSEKYQSTTIIIDALDECYVGTRKSLLSSLHKIVQKATRVKIVVTSRYDVDIIDSFSTSSGPYYYIHSGDNSGDINLYIDAELDRRCHPSNVHCDYDLLLEGKIDPELKALIRSRLQAESNGMYVSVFGTRAGAHVKHGLSSTFQVSVGQLADHSTLRCAHRQRCKRGARWYAASLERNVLADTGEDSIARS